MAAHNSGPVDEDGAGLEVASALPGANGEVQRLPEQPRCIASECGLGPEASGPLAWLPPTVAAVALRLYALDAALVYEPGSHPARDTLEVWAWAYGVMMLNQS